MTDLLTAAGFLLLGTALGWLTNRRRPAHRCGCRHDLAFHAPPDGGCQHSKRRGLLDPDYPRCECQQYTGPPVEKATKLKAVA